MATSVVNIRRLEVEPTPFGPTPYDLTIVMGKRGSGKSTLIRDLAYRPATHFDRHYADRSMDDKWNQVVKTSRRSQKYWRPCSQKMQEKLKERQRAGRDLCVDKKRKKRKSSNK
jgi:predicted kinase